MKKKYTAIGFVILTAVLIAVGALLLLNGDRGDSPTGTDAVKNAQLGVTVDSWLKIIGFDEYNGTLAVVAENVSDTDVEYALLTVKTKSGTLTFNISAFLRGTRAVLLCNQAVALDTDEAYTSWEIKDKLIYEKQPVMHSDVFEASVANGSIALKNISGKDIKSDIYVYYKDKDGDLLNGSITYRTRFAALKANSKTFAKAQEHNENNCQIIFIAYDD